MLTEEGIKAIRNDARGLALRVANAIKSSHPQGAGFLPALGYKATGVPHINEKRYKKAVVKCYVKPLLFILIDKYCLP